MYQGDESDNDRYSDDEENQALIQPRNNTDPQMRDDSSLQASEAAELDENRNREEDSLIDRMMR